MIRGIRGLEEPFTYALESQRSGTKSELLQENALDLAGTVGQLVAIATQIVPPSLPLPEACGPFRRRNQIRGATAREFSSRSS